MASYRDIRTWQLAVALAESVYEMTGTFPSEERFGLASQMRRSAVSIPSNIAEGWGRSRTAEFRRFIDIALGSLCELETQAELACRLGLIPEERRELFDRHSRSTNAALRSLRRQVQRRTN